MQAVGGACAWAPEWCATLHAPLTCRPPPPAWPCLRAGTVSVVRSHPTWREPYSGMVPIVSGEIAEDLAQYLSDSEQQRCALAAAVTLNPDGSVLAAGGYLIQARPESPPPPPLSLDDLR